jgi:hypothetical protein
VKRRIPKSANQTFTDSFIVDDGFCKDDDLIPYPVTCRIQQTSRSAPGRNAHVGEDHNTTGHDANHIDTSHDTSAVGCRPHRHQPRHSPFPEGSG